ncbi:vanadium-dependent haloperoxidase [Nocardioidaceae bacterium]|nr:vanadium-dependent haloperoxidase [Nocardioidaceae bacterium]
MLPALVVTACTRSSEQHGGDESALYTWYEQTDRAVSTSGAPDPVAARTWALAWWAADRAVDRAVEGEEDGAFVDAAVARAVHDVLVAVVPERRARLDAALDPDADEVGEAAGATAAAEVLAERSEDGLDRDSAEGPFDLPPPQPGVWRPTPPGDLTPRQVGVATATPFILESPDQLRPGPPPQPGTERYRRDLAEVRDLGSADSASRTPEQTEVGLFWAGSELAVQVDLVEEAMRAAEVSTVEGVRLLSAFHRITADAEIAVFDAKYTYLGWRPVTAIRVDGDGDPRTPRVPGWEPLIGTPPHPEYPSAHTVYAAAGAAVLEHFLGPEPAAPLEIPGTRTGDTVRTYTSWQQSVTENEDARVWAGIHLRTSDEVGSKLGRRVAAYALARL